MKKIDYPWLLCLPAILLFFFQLMEFSLFNSISKDLIQVFTLSPLKLSWLSSLYYLGMVAAIIPAGISLDRLANKKLILFTLVISCLSVITFAMANSFIVAATCHFILGSTTAIAYLAAIKAGNQYFSDEKRHFSVGVIVSASMLGGIAAQQPFTLISLALGWRNALLVTAGLGVLFAAVILLINKNSIDADCSTNTSSKHIKPAICNVTNWLGGLFICLANLPIYLLASLWANLYLTHTKQLNLLHASFVSSLIFIGLIIGSTFTGYLAEKTKAPIAILKSYALLAALIFFYVIFSSNNNLSVLATCFFTLGFLSACQVLIYPLIAQKNPPEIMGTALAVSALIINLLSVIIQMLFGYLVHTQHTYTMALCILPVGYLLCVVIATKLKR